MSLNFGPLNKEGGWRRLNVAVSRARYEMKVFSTITSDQIDLNRSSSEGVAGLKAFLSYAEKGRDALRYSAVDSAKTDDGIVLSIAEALKEEGFEVQTNIGCSGYRIDLGIVNPANPGNYIAGVLCDGYNYAAAKTTNDREVVQIKTLKLLGWNICRVWALDYWCNRDKTVARLVAQLNAIIDASKASPGAAEENVEPEPTPEVTPSHNPSLDPPALEEEAESEQQPKEISPEAQSETEDNHPVQKDTDTIVREMLEDSSEYEVKPYFKTIIEMIADDGFRSSRQKVEDTIKGLGEMPSAAINSINETYYELIGENLIVEDGEEYMINSEDYDKLKEEE